MKTPHESLAGHAPAHPQPIDPSKFSMANLQFPIRNGCLPPPPAPAHPEPIDPAKFSISNFQFPISNAGAPPPRRNPIERLAPELREQINQLIDDDKPFHEILQWLATVGHAAITEPDLIQYAEGPCFQRWVCDHERLDRMAAQHDMAKQYAEGAHLDDFHNATTAIAQLTFFDLLNRFDSVNLSKRLDEKPELFFPLIKAFCAFSRLRLAREKFEWQKKQAEAKQRARQEKQRARTPIVITADTISSVRAALQPQPRRTGILPVAADEPSPDRTGISPVPPRQPLCRTNILPVTAVHLNSPCPIERNRRIALRHLATTFPGGRRKTQVNRAPARWGTQTDNFELPPDPSEALISSPS